MYSGWSRYAWRNLIVVDFLSQASINDASNLTPASLQRPKECNYHVFYVPFLSLVTLKMTTRKKGFLWKKLTGPLPYQKMDLHSKRSLETETKWKISRNFSTKSMLEVRKIECRRWAWPFSFESPTTYPQSIPPGSQHIHLHKSRVWFNFSMG